MAARTGTAQPDALAGPALRLGLVGGVVAAAAAGAWLELRASAMLGRAPGWPALAQLLSQASVLALAGGLLLRSPRARSVGWALLASGTVSALWLLLTGTRTLGDAQGWARLDLVTLLVDALWPLLLGLPVVLVAQLYPDGAIATRGFRRALAATLTALALDVALVVLAHLRYGPVDVGALADDPEIAALLALHLMLWLGPMCVALGVLVLRWRRGSPLVRQQIGILMLVLLLTLGLVLVSVAQVLPNAAVDLVWAVWPLVLVGSITVAVLRYQLFDVGIVLKRAAVYGVLTAVLTGLFVVVYVTLGVVTRPGLGAGAGWWPVVGAVAVVLCAEPARRRLQVSLERRLLGHRREPLKALQLLRDPDPVDDESTLAALITSTAASAVRSPAVTLKLHREGNLLPVGKTAGETPGSLTIPLQHRGELLGELTVGPRTPDERYGRADVDLLHQLAGQVAALLYGFRRDVELAASRQEALEAAAEERARLGRDLHDGLSPLLAGAGLAAEALRRGLAPGSADEQDAAQLAQRLRNAATETRRLAHGLQPEELRARGLSGALRHHVASFAGSDVPQIDIRADVEALPAGVEQTAYLVALEAINNAVRHARARHVEVTLMLAQELLTLSVRDDGVGLQVPYVAGVGLASMRRRVEALGGVFRLSTPPGGGTVVQARIPVRT